MITRETISHHYLKGKGIEIGAHHNPFPKKNDIEVTYIDKHKKNELIRLFPEITNHENIPENVIIDDGMYLDGFKNDSQDFVIASHVFEHFPSPLTALSNHLRVLKNGGILFYAIPLHNNFIDKNRDITSYTHLELDHILWNDNRRKTSFGHLEEWKQECIENLFSHYDEYLSIVDEIKDPHERRIIADNRIKRNLDIHFHCWDVNEIHEIFKYSPCIHKYEIELFFKESLEVFVVLRKL